MTLHTEEKAGYSTLPQEINKQCSLTPANSSISTEYESFVTLAVVASWCIYARVLAVMKTLW